MAYKKTRTRAKDAPETGTPEERTLAEVRKLLKECVDDESSERAKMADDLRFCTLDQWPADVRKERENDIENGPRPCLTIDKINQYIVQVVNDMRQGKPGINVRPQDDSADIETAKILKGLVRNIEDQSNADIAYATAGESAAKIGLGYFRITTEYVSEDSFDQDIFIRPIPNTFSTYLGPHVMPDGSDAKHGFILETMPLDKFREQYPDAKYKSVDFEDLGDQMTYWHSGETVTVIEYFCLERQRQTLYFLADGTSMTEEDYKAWPEDQGVPPSIQRERTTYKEQLKWKKMTGVEVLEERDLPGKYIPIVEVIGRESHIDGKRHLWGLVRPAKDSLRMYNYFASTITEKMALAPKSPFIGAVGQFATKGNQWKKANRTNYAVLEYDPIDVNGNALPPPQRQGPTPMEAALLQQMQVIEHDVQTSLGMFKAAVGETESQQSGRAILALQRESDTGTYHFGANLGVSIRHAGRIIVEMIPNYYDTKRIVRILGEDGEVQAVQLDPNLPTARQQIPGMNGAMQSIYNPGVGKYDVTITVGPSYNTKRMEAAATFIEMAKGAADPASAAVLRYLVMRNSDTAGSDEAAKLLKTLLPPQSLQAMESKEPIPPQVMAQMQQAQMQMAQMQEEGQKLQQENIKLKSGEQAKMAQIQVESQAKSLQMQLEKADADRQFQLDRWKAEMELQLKRDVAVAEHGIAQEKIEMDKQVKGAELAMKVDEQKREAEMEDEVEAEKLAPQLLKTIQESMERFATALSESNQIQMQVLEHLTKPKQVRLGAIQRDASGKPVGANVTIN
ncbi:MAG: hypothetical protein OEY27_03885 [Gammaproteobacteria bacterium]|nr:hypothetical protein [Gammaproteobacteria bacterium]